MHTNEEQQVSLLDKLSERHIRVAVVGNVDAGKSTLIGTLASSALDDGKGSSRSFIAKRKHEIESGRTSSIATHLIEYDGDGKIVKNPKKLKHRSLDPEVTESSGNCVTLMDMAGHEKYLKTTISGISGGMADYALVLVDAGQAPTHMTLHHLTLCVSTGIPVIVVLTKIDRAPKHVFDSTLEAVKNMLKSPEIGLRPYAVQTAKDVETTKNMMASLVPILGLSTVTGEGLPLLHKMLQSLPQRRRHKMKRKKMILLCSYVDDRW